MAVLDERTKFNQVKRDLLASIESMRKAMPEAAEYFEQHLVIDEEAMTFKYTGDDRLKLKKIE
jgi:hypothetical protein